jgi:two-component system, chemotaxis family, protein-glutamate methylesterase/glutaminase
VPQVAQVVVGASAGGVEALQALVAGLPVDLDAAVLVVLHIPRTGPSVLPRILSRAGPLPAAHPVDGEVLRPGHIYVAPADYHLLVMNGKVRLSRGPAENGHRPAVDPLFRSAARDGGRNAVAVVLSGSRDDGTAGAAAIVERGGRLFVQDPDDALYPSMPRNAMDHVPAERVCPAAELGSAVAEAVRVIQANRAIRAAQAVRAVRAAQDATAGPGVPAPAEDPLALEVAMADLDALNVEALSTHAAGLACPACHGALFELPGEPTPRYRCWVGHAWSPQSLLDEQAAALEDALWIALRSLEEKASLARRMAVAAEGGGRSASARRVRRTGHEAERAAHVIRTLLGRLDRLADPSVDAESER